MSMKQSSIWRQPLRPFPYLSWHSSSACGSALRPMRWPFPCRKAVRFPTRLVQIGEGKLVCRVSLLGTPSSSGFCHSRGCSVLPHDAHAQIRSIDRYGGRLLANFLMIALLGIWQNPWTEDLSPGF